MIAPYAAQRVRKLLAEGNLSQRKIAVLTGVSRGTVSAIAAGRRPDYPRRQTGSEERQAPELDGPPVRCPGCGGMVYMPCRLCRTRAMESNRPKPAIPPRVMPLDEPLGLGLRGEHRARYQQVRTRRTEAERAALQGVGQQRPEPEEDEVDFDAAGFPHLAELDDADLFGDPDEENLDDWNDLRAMMT